MVELRKNEIFGRIGKISETLCLVGVPGGIRTHGLKIRNLALYPAELREQRDSGRINLGYFKGFVYFLCDTFCVYQVKGKARTRGLTMTHLAWVCVSNSGQ